MGFNFSNRSYASVYFWCDPNYSQYIPTGPNIKTTSTDCYISNRPLYPDGTIISQVNIVWVVKNNTKRKLGPTFANQVFGAPFPQQVYDFNVVNSMKTGTDVNSYSDW